MNIGLGNRHVNYVMFKQAMYMKVKYITDEIILSMANDKIPWGLTFQSTGRTIGITGFFFYIHSSQNVHVFNIGLF